MSKLFPSDLRWEIKDRLAKIAARERHKESAMSRGGVVDRANAGYEEEWVQEAADREAELHRIMSRLPGEFALRWCEPGEGGCACLGCANGPEAGSGNLAALGFTIEDWRKWWKLRAQFLDDK